MKRGPDVEEKGKERGRKPYIMPFYYG